MDNIAIYVVALPLLLAAAYMFFRSILQEPSLATIYRASSSGDGVASRRAIDTLKALYPEFADTIIVTRTNVLRYRNVDFLLSKWEYPCTTVGRFGPVSGKGGGRCLIAIAEEAVDILERQHSIFARLKGDRHMAVYALRSLSKLASQLQKERLKKA